MKEVLRARGGWWHDYVCPTHGVELDPARGDSYPCRYGCTHQGEAFDGAWVVLEHQARAREARLAARQSRSEGAPADRERALAILTEFAAYYAEVAAGGESERAEGWMLKGKLFSQALTEAIWGVQIADAVLVLATDESSRPVLVDQVAPMIASLLDTVAEAWDRLVLVREEPANNYVAWLNAAGAGLSQALTALGHSDGDPRAVPELWLDRTLAYLDLAVDAEGWEWEGSTYYHLFVLRAGLLSLRGVDPASIPAATKDRLAAMVAVLIRLAGPDGALPSLHDGPYDRLGVHLEVLEISVLARQLWTQIPLETVEAWVRNRLGAEHDGLEDQLDGWFGGPALPWPLADDLRVSAHFASTGYVVLHDRAERLTAVLDAGPHGGSHGHLDKLALYLYGDGVAWQPAPGVPPYGSGLRRGYYSRTLAQPTVRVDGVDQHATSGTVDLVDLNPSADTDRVVAGSGDAFSDAYATRELVRTASYLLDIVRVRVTGPRSTEDRNDDDVARGNRPATAVARDLTLALRPAVPFEVTATAGGWRTFWHGPAGQELHGFHRASAPSTLVASPGRGPSDDPAMLRTVGDWTARGTSACFVSAYCVDDARVADVELTTAPHDPTAEGEAASALLAVRIHMTDGTTTEHEVAR